MRFARFAVIGVLVTVFLLVGCRGHASDATLASAASGSASSEPAPLRLSRRPTERYYLGRTLDRCFLFSADGSFISTQAPTPCPADLLPGERIRITGKTCLRESTDLERRQPFVCPAPLIKMENDANSVPSTSAPHRRSGPSP